MEFIHNNQKYELLLLHLGQPFPDKWYTGTCSKSPWIGQVIITLILLLV